MGQNLYTAPPPLYVFEIFPNIKYVTSVLMITLTVYSALLQWHAEEVKFVLIAVEAKDDTPLLFPVNNVRMLF